MMRGNWFKKSISLIVAFVLVFGIAAPAFAANNQNANEDKIGYIALGDAMTFGEGLNVDPENEEDREIPYPELVAQALAEKGLIDGELDYSTIGDKKYRVEELRYLLDMNYAGDGYTDAIGGMPTLRKNAPYAEWVAGADYITINVGVNNFASYIVKQLVYYLENDGEQLYDFNYDAISEELSGITDADVLAVADSIEDAVMDVMLEAASDNGDIALEFINYAVEVSTYTILSYMANYNALIARIYELNPDVNLYVVGIYNPAAGETLTYDFNEDGEIGQYESIPVGDIFGAIVEMANS